MLKRLKSVSMLLFLMGASTGAAYAVANPGVTDVKITQQSGTCTGVVKDATGETVIGASVVVKGTTNGTITGLDGDFSLSNVKKGDIIQISFVGYQTQEVKWTGQPIDVTLKDDTQQLGEVVVTALGLKREEKALGYAVQKVKGDNLPLAKTVDVATSLTGKVAGLNIQNSTEFNETPKIKLRGETPLIIVDGVPYGNITLDEIASDDIESIDVLKGATASALYGARGTSGAIMITTKKGANEEG